MRDCRDRLIRVLSVAGLISSCFVGHAAAQQPPGDAPARTWQVTFYGGFATGGTPTGGAGFLPPAGDTFVPVPFAAPTRRVATWWLGDGTALLNEVLLETTPPGPPGSTPPAGLTALDSLVMSGIVQRRQGIVAGARATRRLNRRFNLEAGVEIGLQPLALTTDAQNQLHAIRGAFSSTFDTLLARAHRSDRQVTATLTAPPGSPRQSAVSVAVIYNFRPDQEAEPYVIAGGGVLLSSGSVHYTLEGRYSFVTGPLTTGETDTLRVTTDWSNSALAVVGAGVRRAVSARTGFSAEARVSLSHPRPRTHIDATPVRDPATSGSFGAVVFPTTPSLAIVGPNSMGFDSNLSAPAITDFTTFDGTGRLLSVAVTFGYFVAF